MRFGRGLILRPAGIVSLLLYILTNVVYVRLFTRLLSMLYNLCGSNSKKSSLCEFPSSLPAHRGQFKINTIVPIRHRGLKYKGAN